MAILSSLATLRRFQRGSSRTSLHPVAVRVISSLALPIELADESSSRCATPMRSLKNEILKVKCLRGGVTPVLQEWVDSGRCPAVSELRFISRLLFKSKRYQHALEVLEWMETRKGFQMSVEDHAAKLELIIKVGGLMDAEEYFAKIYNTASQKAACLPLLRSYVKERTVEKAEALMKKLNGLGLLVSPHPFNEMMKLYVATCQYEKVPLVIMQMKHNKIPRDTLSYNLWMGACGELSGVASVEKIVREMMNDENVDVGWSTLVTMANVYAKGGFIEQAILILENAEKKLNKSKHLGYFFLITLYASLNCKEGVLRVWKATKSVRRRMTCANYMCILSCLVKLGDLNEAERIFREWESNCRNYDVRVSNILLGAYVRNGLMGKAESLHIQTLRRGASPNFKTWEILLEGWVNHQKIEQAIDAMKNALSLMKCCHWRPSQKAVMGIAEYYEMHGKLEEANMYITLMHRFGLANLALYKVLIRMHIRARRPAFKILEMMKKDNIEIDDETYVLCGYPRRAC